MPATISCWETQMKLNGSALQALLEWATAIDIEEVKFDKFSRFITFSGDTLPLVSTLQHVYVCAAAKAEEAEGCFIRTLCAGMRKRLES